jgi:hypothetical protein
MKGIFLRHAKRLIEGAKKSGLQLSNIANTLPSDVGKELLGPIVEIQNQLKSLKESVLTPMMTTLSDINSGFNIFTNKPTVMGKFVEKTLRLHGKRSLLRMTSHRRVNLENLIFWYLSVFAMRLSNKYATK